MNSEAVRVEEASVTFHQPASMRGFDKIVHKCVRSATTVVKKTSCFSEQSRNYAHVQFNRNRRFIHSHNGVASGRMDYVRGWAYQQCLLDRRLKALRHFINEKQDEKQDDSDLFQEMEMRDTDRILMFEHDHVYTLGRGADEDNLTFLDHIEGEGGEEARRRLSRKTRGRDSCRLGSEIMKPPANSTLHDAVNYIG